MVGEELERDDSQQRGETLFGLGHLDDIIGDLGDHLISFGDDGDDASFAGFDLLDIRHDLLVGAATWRHDDHRHLLGDEGDRSVLHLRRRVTLCVDIGYLLQFEGTLHRYGVVIAATEVDKVLGVRKGLGEVRDAFLLLEHAGDLIGDAAKLAHDTQVLLFAHRPFLLTDTKSEHGERGHLGGEGLGGRDAYLRTDVGIATAVGDTGDGCTDDVTDANCIAASVSAVSPDWEIAMTTSSLLITGLR